MAAKQSQTPAAGDTEIRALLEHYACPVPFHAVRTRFLGAIASPTPLGSPMAAVQTLWGGKLPEFQTVDDANALLGALVMGLWNRLTLHQEPGHPFRLVQIDVSPDRAGLAELATVRRDEVMGFIFGLFGPAKAIDLPEGAHFAVKTLQETAGMFEGMRELAANPAKALSQEDAAHFIDEVGKIVEIVEREIHETAIACKAMRAAPPPMPKRRRKRERRLH